MLVALLLLATVRPPETCIVVDGEPAVTVTYGGTTYGFRYAECREDFLSDPERLSQLYDALLEIHAAGKPIEPERPSLVPS